MAYNQVGTGFSNLSQIIGANQNNKLGSTIQSGIQSDVNKAQTDVNNAQNQFQTDFNAGNTYGYNTNNEALVNQDLNNASNANAFATKQSGAASGTGTDVNNASQNNKSSSGPAAADISAFEQFRSGNQYTGPTALANFSALQNQGQNIHQLGQNTTSQGGQFNLLKQYVGGNQNYNQGEQNLDSLILGQTGQGQLQAARQATQGVAQGINQAGTNAAAQATGQIGANQDYSKRLTSQIAGQTQSINDIVGQQAQLFQQSDAGRQNAINDLITKLNSTQTSAAPSNGTGVQTQNTLNPDGTSSLPQNARDTLLNGLTNLQNSGYLTADQRTKLNPLLANSVSDELASGATPEQINAIIASNLGYNSGSNLTKQGVMTAEEAAQLNALSKLGGTGQEITSFGNASLGGLNLGANSIYSRAQNDARNTMGSAFVGDKNISTADESNNISNTGPSLQNLIGSDYTATLPAGGTGTVAEQQAASALAAQRAALAQLGVTSPTTDTQKNQNNNLQYIYDNTKKWTPPDNTFKRPGFGGISGPTVICTELHRQGLLSDELYNLDKMFARKFISKKPDAYRGYLMVAKPVVTLMRKHPRIAKIVSYVGIPWAKHMAHEVDDKYEDSKLGKFIQITWTSILPLVYRAKCKLDVLVKKWKQ